MKHIIIANKTEVCGDTFVECLKQLIKLNLINFMYDTNKSTLSSK